jgi:glycosyltransferase involved in cell wall biosynthesis
MPSRADTAPLAVAEAMACSRPVVATSVGGIPELVRDGVTGTLVEVDDTDALVNACRHLLDSPELRAAYGSAGLAAVAPYSLDVVVQEWLDIYARLIERRGQDPA